jgi:hypothetical protein
MVDATPKIGQLKEEINGILSRYGIPLDDRSFILEKVEESVNSILNEQIAAFQRSIDGVRGEISLERENVRKEVDKIKQVAFSNLSDVQVKINEAYEEGFSQGQSDTPAPSSGPSTFQVVIGLSLVTIALVIAARKIWKD